MAKLRIAALYLVLAVVLLCLTPHRDSCEIRVDCGDLRYNDSFFMPVRYERMHEPARSVLIGLAEQSGHLKPEWKSIPMQSGSNRVHRMCRSFYEHGAAWAEIDPAIAIIVLEDIAEYINRTSARHGLPECVALLMATRHGDVGRRVVLAGWKRDSGIIYYLESKGIDPDQYE